MSYHFQSEGVILYAADMCVIANQDPQGEKIRAVKWSVIKVWNWDSCFSLDIKEHRYRAISTETAGSPYTGGGVFEVGSFQHSTRASPALTKSQCKWCAPSLTEAEESSSGAPWNVPNSTGNMMRKGNPGPGVCCMDKRYSMDKKSLACRLQYHI